MNRSTRLITITAIVAVAALGVAALVFFTSGVFKAGEPTVISESMTFSPAAISKIEAKTSSTDIRVFPSRSDQIEVRLTGEARTSNPDAIPTLATSIEGGRLTIGTQRSEERRLYLGFVSQKLMLEIALPERFVGQFTLDSSSGDITVTELSVDGTRIETSSGEIDLRSVGTLTGSSVVESSSGDLLLDIGALEGNLRLESSSGDVTVTLPGNASFEFAADTSSGDLDVEFPVTITGDIGDESRREIEGTVGSGTFRLDVDTSSGDIRIRRSGM